MAYIKVISTKDSFVFNYTCKECVLFFWFWLVTVSEQLKALSSLPFLKIDISVLVCYNDSYMIYILYIYLMVIHEHIENTCMYAVDVKMLPFMQSAIKTSDSLSL